MPRSGLSTIMRQVPPYSPGRSEGLTASGSAGRRCASGGSLPARTSSDSIGASRAARPPRGSGRLVRTGGLAQPSHRRHRRRKTDGLIADTHLVQDEDTIWYTTCMSQTQQTRTLDRLLDPVSRCLTPDAARQLVALRADPDLQERMDALADKNTEGQLTAEEREENTRPMSGPPTSSPSFRPRPARSSPSCHPPNERGHATASSIPCERSSIPCERSL